MGCLVPAQLGGRRPWCRDGGGAAGCSHRGGEPAALAGHPGWSLPLAFSFLVAGVRGQGPVLPSQLAPTQPSSCCPFRLRCTSQGMAPTADGQCTSGDAQRAGPQGGPWWVHTTLPGRQIWEHLCPQAGAAHESPGILVDSPLGAQVSCDECRQPVGTVWE